MTMTKIKLSNNKEESNLKGYDYEYKNEQHKTAMKAEIDKENLDQELRKKGLI